MKTFCLIAILLVTASVHSQDFTCLERAMGDLVEARNTISHLGYRDGVYSIEVDKQEDAFSTLRSEGWTISESPDEWVVRREGCEVTVTEVSDHLFFSEE